MSVPKEPHYSATDLIEESDAFYGYRKYFGFRTEQDYAGFFAHCRQGQLRERRLHPMPTLEGRGFEHPGCQSSVLERQLRDEFGSDVERVSALVGRDLRPVWGYSDM